MQQTTDSSTTTSADSPSSAVAQETRDFLAGRDKGATDTELQVAIRRRRQVVLVTVAAMVNHGTLRSETIRLGNRDATVYHLQPVRRVADGTKPPTGCDRILARLQRGPATHDELYQLHCVVHSRIADLRRRGHNIPRAELTVTHDGRRIYTYRLLAREQAAEKRAA